MSASLNLVQFIGNAGRDADLRYTTNGTAKADWPLGVNYRTKEGDGTEWVQCVMWGERAEKVAGYIAKGKQLYVSGRLQTRSWEDDQGQKHYRTEVVANDVQFLDRKQSSTDDERWE